MKYGTLTMGKGNLGKLLFLSSCDPHNIPIKKQYVHLPKYLLYILLHFQINIIESLRNFPNNNPLCKQSHFHQQQS